METLKLKGKKVLVLGLGLQGGGISTVRFLARHGARITVTDLKSAEMLAPSLKKLKNIGGIRYLLGHHSEKEILDADLIVKNPDLPAHSPWLQIAKKHHIPITTDLGFFLKNNPATLIGVTGTRGKSTTAHLLWKFLKEKYKRVYLGGNIPQKSVLDFLDRLKRGDIVVLELSSFQLRDIAGEKISPHIAIFTNIFRDHLNKHQNMRDYISSKNVIFKFQKKGGFIFANGHDPKVRSAVKRAPGNIMFPNLTGPLAKIVTKNLGGHFVSSIGLAIAVAKHLNVSETAIKNILIKFKGLPNRQEEIAVIKGVHFINDTTSTIPDATIAAIARFRKQAGSKKLILIAGGQNKNLDFKKMISAIIKQIDILLMLPGTATDIMSPILKKTKTKFSIVKTMDEAVLEAYAKARSGDYIVLSPGATSFGSFLNEFDRGDAFVRAVKKLKNQ